MVGGVEEIIGEDRIRWIGLQASISYVENILRWEGVGVAISLKGQVISGEMSDEVSLPLTAVTNSLELSSAEANAHAWNFCNADGLAVFVSHPILSQQQMGNRVFQQNSLELTTNGTSCLSIHSLCILIDRQCQWGNAEWPP